MSAKVKLKHYVVFGEAEGIPDIDQEFVGVSLQKGPLDPDHIFLGTFRNTEENRATCRKVCRALNTYQNRRAKRGKR